MVALYHAFNSLAESGTLGRDGRYPSLSQPGRRAGNLSLIQTSQAESAGTADTELEEATRYRVLVESVTDYAIYMLDPSGIITSWNAGAQRFKGYSRAEIIGQTAAFGEWVST